VGETTKCSNDASVILKNCVNGAWQSTGNTCPTGGTETGNTTTTTCTNTCPSGYTRTVYPDCKCLAPNQTSTSVCSPNSVLTATCPDGNVITTYSCINGGWSPVENCTTTSTGGGTIVPPQTTDNTTLFVILFGVVFLVAVIGVVGLSYIFAGSGRRR
jgi:hypothetical protein